MKPVWIDESYVNKNHWCKYGYFIGNDNTINKPSGVGTRCCLIAAVNENGWVGTENKDEEDIFNDLSLNGKCGSICYFKV